MNGFGTSSYGWDFDLIFPIIREYLSQRNFPDAVSATAIQDTIAEDPRIQNCRIVRMELVIGHGLRSLGYRKNSHIGRGYEKSNIGLILPACV